VVPTRTRAAVKFTVEDITLFYLVRQTVLLFMLLNYSDLYVKHDHTRGKHRVYYNTTLKLHRNDSESIGAAFFVLLFCIGNVMNFVDHLNAQKALALLKFGAFSN
jgi:hypothetical protein